SPWRKRWGHAVPVCGDHLLGPSQAHHQPGGDLGQTPLPHG
ncbi:platelet factor 4 isoform 2, partial [Daubentonia madagascariensis]